MRKLLLTFFLYPILCFSQQDTNGWFLANTGVDGTKNYIKILKRKVHILSHVGSKWFSGEENKKGVKIGGGYSLVT